MTSDAALRRKVEEELFCEPSLDAAIVSKPDVKVPASTRVTDEEIAQAAIQVLSWTALAPKDRISVRVEHGWVVLEGEVDWHYQKAAAAGSAIKDE